MALPEHARHFPHIPVPDFRGGLRWVGHHWKPVGLSIAALAGSGYLALAQDRGPDTSPVTSNAPASDTIKPPEQAPNVGIIPNISKEPTPPAETQKPPTPETIQAPEVKTELKYGLLSPELAALGVWVIWTDSERQEWDIIGFKLPKGTVLKSHMKGQMTKAKLFDKNGKKIYHAGIIDPKNLAAGSTWAMDGAFNFNDDLRTQNIEESGEIIRIEDTDIPDFDGSFNNGAFNVTITANRWDSAKKARVTDESFKQAYAEAFSRTPIRLKYKGPTSPPIPQGGGVYLPKDQPIPEYLKK